MICEVLRMEKREDVRERGLLRRIFPEGLDFYVMLIEITDQSREGVEEFLIWLDKGHLADIDHLEELDERMDETRYRMEHELHEAFATPIDREEIYIFSRQVDYLVNNCVMMARQMQAYDVPPDAHMKVMAENLVEAMKLVSESLRLLKGKDGKADDLIKGMRKCQHRIEHIYIQAMAELFKTEEPMRIFRQGEVYASMMENGKNLRNCIDTLHRILVAAF
jgi:uncharacterized protein Yka (UPF0111/DUF47 family)